MEIVSKESIICGACLVPIRSAPALKNTYAFCGLGSFTPDTFTLVFVPLQQSAIKITCSRVGPAYCPVEDLTQSIPASIQSSHAALISSSVR